MAYTALSAASAGQLINASWMNTYLRDNLNALNGNGKVPTAAIVWWPASGASRPDTWYECDGTFGVIDLRDRIIIGAGSTYAVQAVGGAVSAAQSAHTAHSIAAPAHGAHAIGASPAHGISTFGNTLTGAAQTIINTDTHASGSSEGFSHANHALTDTHAHTGSPFSILPPYLALTAILKNVATVSFPTPRTWADGDVPTAAMFNQDLRDGFQSLRQQLLWNSTVLLWSGSLAALPSGYQLCDGTNGTPDMRDRFAISAGSSYSALATGGAASLAIPAHSNHVATQPDAHANHANVTIAAHGATVAGIAAGSDQSTSTGAHTVQINGAHGAHSGFAVDAHSAHAAVATLPPYIALGYIQLTSAGTYTAPRTWTDGELIDAGRVNTYLRDNEAALYNGQVPIGAIVVWQNSIASIPANYAHCDGSGGRVDTRDRFILGAGLSYSVGAPGGAATVTPAAHPAHVVTSPNAHSNHSLSQPSAHSLDTAPTISFGGLLTYFTPSAVMSHSFSLTAGGLGEHGHSFTLDAFADHSAHDAMALLPPYMALAFIQRTS